MRKHNAFSCYVFFASGFYLLFYIATYFIDRAQPPIAITYTLTFLGRFADMLIPLLGAAVLLPQLCRIRTGELLWRSALLAFPPFFASLLDRYLYFVTGGGLDSLDSLLFGALFALIEVLVGFVLYAALFALVRYLFRRTEIRGRRPITDMRPCAPFDGWHPWLYGTMIVGAPYALGALVTELVDIVNFFLLYFDSYSIGELLYIIASFLFIPLSFLVSLYLAVRLCLYLLDVKDEKTGSQPRRA